jgi:hypothetical protein
MDLEHTRPATPTTEKEALISMALRRVMVDGKGVNNYGWRGEEDEIALLNAIGLGDSAEALTARALPESDKVKFILLSPEQMKRLADCWGGYFVYHRVEIIDLRDEEAIIGIWEAWAHGSRSGWPPAGGGGYRLLYRKQQGEWVFEKVLSAIFVS